MSRSVNSKAVKRGIRLTGILLHDAAHCVSSCQGIAWDKRPGRSIEKSSDALLGLGPGSTERLRGHRCQNDLQLSRLKLSETIAPQVSLHQYWLKLLPALECFDRYGLLRVARYFITAKGG